MYECLDWPSIRFLLNFRQLTPDEQSAVSWVMKNMDLLDRLISVTHISKQALQDIQSAARERNDALMTALAAYASSRKDPAGSCGGIGLL